MHTARSVKRTSSLMHPGFQSAPTSFPPLLLLTLLLLYHTPFSSHSSSSSSSHAPLLLHSSSSHTPPPQGLHKTFLPFFQHWRWKARGVRVCEREGSGWTQECTRESKNLEMPFGTMYQRMGGEDHRQQHQHTHRHHVQHLLCRFACQNEARPREPRSSACQRIRKEIVMVCVCGGIFHCRYHIFCNTPLLSSRAPDTTHQSSHTAGFFRHTVAAGELDKRVLLHCRAWRLEVQLVSTFECCV